MVDPVAIAKILSNKFAYGPLVLNRDAAAV